MLSTTYIHTYGSLYTEGGSQEQALRNIKPGICSATKTHFCLLECRQGDERVSRELRFLELGPCEMHFHTTPHSQLNEFVLHEFPLMMQTLQELNTLLMQNVKNLKYFVRFLLKYSDWGISKGLTFDVEARSTK
jgi:hypothetical protein